jgi:hypothetical protein
MRQARPWGEPAIDPVCDARGSSEIVSTIGSAQMRWLAFLLLVGCGDNLEGIALEQRQAVETAARCERLVRCGVVRDVSTCLMTLRRVDERSLLAAVAAGVIDYNPISERRCLQDMATASCDLTDASVRATSAACAGTLVGTRSAGAQCAFDEECATGRCALESCPRTSCCSGVCKTAVQTVGGSCTAATDCVDTAYCGDGGICRALETLGAPCTTDRTCAFGLGCVGATPLQAGACRDLPSIGDRCPYDRCADINARCANGTCVALGLQGDACTTSSDCTAFHECNSGECSALPSLGMPCTLNCAGDSSCRNGICAAPLQEGDPCGADNECESQLCAEGPIFDVCASRPVCI